ncbi:hypothetical protein EDB83DRAFT_2387703 [Lactarius deliciosus]|nr:hypothetical protein EDB83DRAFT_2387703 [Lactarius deliciosus]
MPDWCFRPVHQDKFLLFCFISFLTDPHPASPVHGRSPSRAPLFKPRRSPPSPPRYTLAPPLTFASPLPPRYRARPALTPCHHDTQNPPKHQPASMPTPTRYARPTTTQLVSRKPRRDAIQIRRARPRQPTATPRYSAGSYRLTRLVQAPSRHQHSTQDPATANSQQRHQHGAQNRANRVSSLWILYCQGRRRVSLSSPVFSRRSPVPRWHVQSKSVHHGEQR